jgi:Histidine kinase-, DNA gyrase B-, and HSP90-like ATPase
MTPASDQIRDDDFSERHPLQVDLHGTHKTLRELQGGGLYDVIKEVLQNSFDSKSKGLENRIEIYINPNAELGQPWLTVTDHGDGITRDYDGNLDRFLNAVKATSEKRRREGTMGNKGVGMFQYTHLGRHIIMTSIDIHPIKGTPEMIYRIPLYLTEEDWTAYGLTTRKPATEEYMEEFGLDHLGTKVAFFDLGPGREPIEEKKLRKVLRDQYTVILAENPNCIVEINGTKVELPKWIREHPPKLIQRLPGEFNIRGALWEDKDGAGEIRIYKDGQWVENHTFEARQCSGYFNIDNCEAFRVNAPRTQIMRDAFWTDLSKRMLKEVSRFPKLTSDKENTSVSRVIPQMVKDALQDILKKAPTAFGGNPKATKILSTGDIHGVGVIGYRFTPTEPDPDREIKKRKKHMRNNANQQQIGPEGTDPVKKESDEIEKRNQYPAMVEVYRGLGDKPMLQLLIDRSPAQLLINTDNPEWTVVKKSKTRQEKALVITANTSEIINNVSEGARIVLYKDRVKGLKSMGQYPKEASPQAKSESKTWS